MLDWRVATFLDACETLNLTRTAERLSISQPAVSQHIAWLERALGARLFAREGRTLALTDAGKLARDALRIARSDEKLLMREIAALSGAERRVRLGATLTAGEHVLARPLARWCAAHPRVIVSVKVADTAALLARIDDGSLDAALVEGFFDAARYDARTWQRERMVCVGAPERAHALGERHPSFRDLLGETLLVREPGSGSRAVLEAALAHACLSVESFARSIEVSSLGMACEMAAAGAGITFAYEAAVRTRCARGELAEIPLREEGLSHPFSFLWQKGSAFAADRERLFAELRG